MRIFLWKLRLSWFIMVATAKILDLWKSLAGLDPDGSDSCRELGHRSPWPSVHPPLHGLVQEIQVFLSDQRAWFIIIIFGEHDDHIMIFRMLNKIMAHITQPFKTFRAEEPSHQMLQVHQVQGTSGTRYTRYRVHQLQGTPIQGTRYTRNKVQLHQVQGRPGTK